MQIKKINNQKLKVVLSANDLEEKNVDINSFLANSIASQDLFFEILDLAEEQYGFNIEGNKAVVETISLDNNLFVLTITKMKNNSPTTENSSPFVFRFQTPEDLLVIYPLLKENSYLYELGGFYYVLLKEPSSSLKNMLLEHASILLQPSWVSILEEHGNRIL